MESRGTTSDIGDALRASGRSQRAIALALGISERHLRRIAAGERGCPADLKRRIFIEATRLPDSWCDCRRETVQNFVVALISELVPVLNEVDARDGLDLHPNFAALTARHVGSKIRDAVDRRDAAVEQSLSADRRHDFRPEEPTIR